MDDDVLQKMRQVLKEAGTNKITRSAYDTAWIARLGEFDQTLSNQALNWLVENQLPDGSWGASAPLNYHDRMICTLAAMVALTRHGRRSQDRRQIESGQKALEMLSKGATRGLMADAAGETCGFNMIMPTLLAEVASHNIITYQHDSILERLTRRRAAKLEKLPEGMINRNVTLAYSTEMVGPDGVKLLDIENLQDPPNGSIACSPASTAFFYIYVRQDPAALKFLQDMAINGAGATIEPIDNYEYAWITWNLSLLDDLDDETLNLCKRSLDALQSAWNTDGRRGIAVVGPYSIADADTTAVAYAALKHFGYDVELERSLLSYEVEECFSTFELESEPSISTNVHVLRALREAGYKVEHPAVQKVLRFLKQVQTRHSFWFDKWHASPYYATSHAIIAAAGYADELVIGAIDWMLNTQNEDGSWGYYNMSSAEETAYCLQALAVWKQQGKGDEEISNDILKRGADWLLAHMHEPYPYFWIGKSFYCPELVVESAVLGALMQIESISTYSHSTEVVESDKITRQDLIRLSNDELINLVLRIQAKQNAKPQTDNETTFHQKLKKENKPATEVQQA